MSGGSYDYAYKAVEQFAECLEQGQTMDGRDTGEGKCPFRLEFAEHLRRVAAAMKAVEWEDSHDCSPPHAVEAIMRVIADLRDTVT